VNPIGLTRAEEAGERAPAASATAQPKAPAGALACRVVVTPPGEACGAAAVALIVWPRDPEADKTPACFECAGRMREVARSFGSDIRLEPLT
jgi:hypothetical protein